MSEYTSPLNFIDLKAQQRTIRSDLDQAIRRVLDHGHYIQGPEVRELEASLSSYTATRHVITCANGTDAITAVLMAWGIGPGDAVMVPDFTYVATAESVAQLGATPIFVDVDSQSFNICVNDLQSKFAMIPNHLCLKAVIGVDLFGQPCNAQALSKLTKEWGVKLLIDAAQSFGASLQGVMVGGWGDATTTSFFPAKPLGCYGDGGAIFTNCDELAGLVRSICLHGKGSHKYEHTRIGFNSRLDSLQAAILSVKLRVFPEEFVWRNRVADIYTTHFEGVCLAPRTMPHCTSSWAQYTILVPDRDELKHHLDGENIPSVVYYPIPLSRQDAFQKLSTEGRFGNPISSFVADHCLSLPMHPYLEKADQERVINAVKKHLPDGVLEQLESTARPVLSVGGEE